LQTATAVSFSKKDGYSMKVFNVFATIIIFSFSSFVTAQIISFDIAPVSGNVTKSDAKIYFQSLALESTGSQLFRYIPQNEKGTLGITTTYASAVKNSTTLANNSGVFPKIYMNFKVSGNLYLKGAMSSINQGSNIAQMMAYGFVLVLGEPKPESWVFQWTQSRISGLKEFRTRTIDILFSRKINFRGKYPLKFGTGATIYKINMFTSLHPFLGSKYESSLGYVVFGYDFKWRNTFFTPEIKINSSHIQISVDFNLGF